MNKWSILPNARHIDRVIASLKTTPDLWVSNLDSVGYRTAWEAVDHEARAIGGDSMCNAAIIAAYNEEWTNDLWYMSRGAIWSLVAYEDCGYLLDEKPEHVAVLAGLGVDGAILLYPACLALNKEKVTND